ncbi:putative s-syntaxin [Operophtera brumata]|uniref:Putative s-syntaxin n=1 Tax=Operophtera brumata TaxID=104452 RepID=A0A0L7L633_OPEBR|nr:putative s-syntaxin [Operophtera brumata]
MRNWIHELNGNTQLIRRLHADPTFYTNKRQYLVYSRYLQSYRTAPSSADRRSTTFILTPSADLQDQLDSVVTQSNAVGLKVCGALRQFEGLAARAGRNDAKSRICRLQYAVTRRLFAAALAQHHATLDAQRDTQLRLLHDQIKLTEARRLLRDVEARHEELARLEGALRDVRDLFAQLAHLVAVQVRVCTSVYECMVRGDAARGAGAARGLAT